MKAKLQFIAILAVMLLAYPRSGIAATVSIAELQAGWERTSITATAGNQPTVMQLLKAFDKQWPTVLAQELITRVGDKSYYEDDCVIADCDDFNQATYHRADAEERRLDARLYYTTGGHPLFAVVMEQGGAHPASAACFYSYDPDKARLTPTEVPFADFPRRCADCRVTVTLGNNYDNTIVVAEVAPNGDNWYHHYWFDGAKHVYHDSGPIAYPSDEEETIPPAALKRWENDQVEIYADLINGDEPANYSAWLRFKQSGEVMWLFTTDNLAPARWADMTDGNGVAVPYDAIAPGHIDKVCLLPWSSTLLLVEGCPDARNVWSYIIDLDSREVVQLPSTEGISRIDPDSQLIYAISYRYYPEGGRYSVERAYTADGQYAGDQMIIEDDE